MKMLSTLVPAVADGVFVSAMVLAAPQVGADKSAAGLAPDRAAAYSIARAD